MASITTSALESLYGAQWSSGKLGLALNPGSVEMQLQMRLIKWHDFCREHTGMCWYLWAVYLGEEVGVWITKGKSTPNYRNGHGPISEAALCEAVISCPRFYHRCSIWYIWEILISGLWERWEDNDVASVLRGGGREDAVVPNGGRWSRDLHTLQCHLMVSHLGQKGKTFAPHDKYSKLRTGINLRAKAIVNYSPMPVVMQYLPQL